MKRVALGLLGLLFGSGIAQAETYQLTYTGHTLSPVRGVRPIHHARHLQFIYSSPTPFPTNTCFDLPFSELTSMTDGVDTLQSLAAAGYTYSPGGTRVHLCSNKTGSRIKSWQVLNGFVSPRGHGKFNAYGAESCSGICSQENFYDGAIFGFKYGHKEVSNTAEAGEWKFSVVDR